jgi:hypothetical protein
MKIKINGTDHFIKPLSKLSFNEFNEIMIKGQCNDLQSYLSLFVKMPIKDFMKAELKGAILPVLAEMVFDIDEAKAVKDKKSTVKLGDELHLVNNLELKVVGQQFLYGLIGNRHKEGNINDYEYSLWTLAISLLSGDDIADMGKAQDNYNDLSSQVWTQVLPQAFFLLKRTEKPKINMWMLSIRYMMGLKKISLMTRISKTLLIKPAEKARYNYYARFLTRMKTAF